ncbi:MAG: zinc-binding dehydrogenase, partial [Acidimicrobiales bacterium]
HVLDLYAAGDNPTRSVATLRPGGRMVVITPQAMPAAEVLEAAEVTTTWMLVEPDYASLERLAGMMEAGTLTVVVGETRPLAQMEELHQIGRHGTPFGKLVAIVER